MSVEEFKEKGNTEFRNKNFEPAIGHFTEGLNLDPTNHILYSNRSACYASIQKWDEALADGKKCVELQPTWGKGYARLGAALHGLRKLDEALEAYTKALEFDPSNDAVKDRIAEVKAEKAGPQAGSNPFAKVFGPDTFAKIQLNPTLAPYLQQPDYVQIVNLLIQNPAMVSGFMQDQRIQTTVIELLGIGAQLRHGEGASRPPPTESSSKAPAPKPAAKPAAPAPPQDPSLAAKERGNAHYKKREFDLSLQCYEEAITLDPSNGSFYLNKSSVYYEQGEFQRCLDEVSQALQKYEDKVIKADFVILGKLLTRKAQALQKLKNFPEAIETYKAALREHRNGDTLTKLNDCEAERKKHDAEQYLDPEIATQEKDKGNTLFREQKFPEAVAAYSESIKRNPKDHTVYSNRAAAFMKLGAYDDAVKDCDACLEIEPNFLKAVVRLAQCYFFRKEYHRAIQQYEKGLKLDPNHEECRDGILRTRSKIMEGMSSGEVDEERIARAKNDPEIRDILGDSYMQFVLRELSMDPSRADEYLSDPNIAAKIQKLAQAGILSFGSGPREGATAGKKR